MGVRVDCGRPEPGILPAVARHLFFGLKQVEIASREVVQLADAPGLRTHLRAHLDDQPVEVDAVTIRMHGCLYDFLLVAPPAHFAEAGGDFERFLQSWRPEGHP